MPSLLPRRHFLLAGGAALLAGCGQTVNGKGGKSPASITIWYESGLPIASTLQDLITSYNATKPAVPAIAQPQPDLSIKLLVVIGAHDAPDVVVYPRSRAWSLVSRGAGFPLNELAHRDNVTATLFSPRSWEGGMVNDQLWGLPIGLDATVLAASSKLLDSAKVAASPDWSTNNFDAACAALVKRDSRGQLQQTGAILSSGLPFEIWLWQQGADILTADGRAAAFDGPAGLKSLQWLIANQQVNGGALAIGRLVSTATLTEGVSGAFTHGKLAMMPATYGTFVRLKKQPDSLPMRLVTLPTLVGGSPATLADNLYAFAPAQSADPHPEGAWQFIRWLATDPKAQAALFGGGTIPSLLAAQQAPPVAGDPDAAVMLQALRSGRVEQNFPWTAEVAGQLNAMIPQALDGRLSAQQALDQARAQAARTIEQDVTLQPSGGGTPSTSKGQ